MLQIQFNRIKELPRLRRGGLLGEKWKNIYRVIFPGASDSEITPAFIPSIYHYRQVATNPSPWPVQEMPVRAPKTSLGAPPSSETQQFELTRKWLRLFPYFLDLVSQTSAMPSRDSPTSSRDGSDPEPDLAFRAGDVAEDIAGWSDFLVEDVEMYGSGYLGDLRDGDSNPHLDSP